MFNKEFLERTEVAGNSVKTYTEEKVMENQETITITVSAKEITENLNKKVMEGIQSIINTLESKIDELKDTVDHLEDSIEREVEDYIENKYDFELAIEQAVDNNMHTITESVVANMDISDQIDSHLLYQLNNYNLNSTCTLAKAAQKVIVDTMKHEMSKDEELVKAEVKVEESDATSQISLAQIEQLLNLSTIDQFTKSQLMNLFKGYITFQRGIGDE